MDLEQLKGMCSEDVLELNAELFDLTKKVKIGHKNKYNARKITVDGTTFDSKGEYRRWLTLVAMQETGLIKNLQRQVRFVLQDAFVDESGKKQRAITYSADFVYEEAGVTVIEDFKSAATARSEAFRIRWRMMQSKFASDSLVKLAVIS